MNAGTDSYNMPPQHGMQFANSNMAFNGDKKSSLPNLTFSMCADEGLDYVFVDEHNRHKRLKGSSIPLLPRPRLEADLRHSDESV